MKTPRIIEYLKSNKVTEKTKSLLLVGLVGTLLSAGYGIYDVIKNGPEEPWQIKRVNKIERILKNTDGCYSIKTILEIGVCIIR